MDGIDDCSCCYWKLSCRASWLNNGSGMFEMVGMIVRLLLVDWWVRMNIVLWELREGVRIFWCMLMGVLIGFIDG